MCRSGSVSGTRSRDDDLVIQWHGWATILDSPSQEDHWPDAPDATLDRVRRVMDEYDERGNEVVDLRCMNGFWHVWLSGNHNHNHIAADLRNLYASLAEVAPGSYGVLYVFDDEDPEHGNEWIVWVMRRGQITSRLDLDLSPHIGGVEDPLEP
jgi:hypothetical protein